MKINVTPDIPRLILDEFVTECSIIIPEITFQYINFRGVEHPSFIQLMGQVVEWITPLKLASSVFLGQIAKLAAEDFWKNKAKIALALKNVAVTPLRYLVNSMIKIRSNIHHNTMLIIGVPFSDSYFGITFLLKNNDEFYLAYALASFVSKISEIQEVINEEIQAGRVPLGDVKVYLNSDGSFKLRWLDKTDMKKHERKVG